VDKSISARAKYELGNFPAAKNLTPKYIVKKIEEEI
jgi:hypothetical protein